MYEPQVGDVIALTNVRSECIDDLNRPPRFYLIAYVDKANDIDEFPDALQFKILTWSELWVCSRLELVLKDSKVPGSIVGCLTQLRAKCTNTLKCPFQWNSVPINKYSLKNFCLENACLIFCTASTSSKLHVVAGTGPLELLVIDEAAQLKECESAIPLQLSSLRHAILVGDERQLPAMVKSEIAASADFGRSLFGRLAKLGYKKHLLNVQYRMHPSVSLFPKREFYNNQILDGPML
ncbi:putative P-loop containing nucleoside triphosphate hydrolase [Rosa chinensis]|uniref:Putative P-loop containing nucleoside triphosphate hydrolase n=1 Tax=Rosa chinensis TaxID=74649 RepID=A0A2P6RFQ3_ROSCH|nr:putative P-loop containing nucleoside triphosphate hydrolase [Rosa chinensis]